MYCGRLDRVGCHGPPTAGRDCLGGQLDLEMRCHDMLPLSKEHRRHSRARSCERGLVSRAACRPFSKDILCVQDQQARHRCPAISTTALYLHVHVSTTLTMRWHDAATYLEWRRCFHADRRKRTESELVVGKDGAWVVWPSQSDVQRAWRPVPVLCLLLVLCFWCCRAATA